MGTRTCARAPDARPLNMCADTSWRMSNRTSAAISSPARPVSRSGRSHGYFSRFRDDAREKIGVRALRVTRHCRRLT